MGAKVPVDLASAPSPLADAVEGLAPQIAASLGRRYQADAAFRVRVRCYVVEALGWTFLGRPGDLQRLARLAAVALVADVGYYAALRRHYPALAAPEASAARVADLVPGPPEPNPLAPIHCAQGRVFPPSGTEPAREGGSGRARASHRLAPIALHPTAPTGGQGRTDLGSSPRDVINNKGRCAQNDTDLLRELASDGVPEPALWRLCADATRFDLANFPADAIGPLWEGVAPVAERRQVGQFYSAVDPIDLILAFCLRSPGDALLDPACGSGAFLVRALARLTALAPDAPPSHLAAQLYGIDLDPLALRLAGYNVAARCGAAPDLRQGDFFALGPAALPAPAAVVGNPPYTRQELLDDRAAGAKGRARHVVRVDWGRTISGRAGLHVPFLLHAAAFLPPGGRLGMLTSNSWLNADYGRDLRRFLLERCRIIAVVAPAGERWFGAAVNAVLLIAQREDAAAARAAHRARFVHLNRPLAALIGAGVESAERWPAVDRLITRIAQAEAGGEDADLRVRVVTQAALGDATRWAVYLHAPDVYFDLLRRAGDRLRPLGDLATVRRGLTTGANAFFYVRDLSGTLDDAALAAVGLDREEPGALRQVAAGDGSHHVIEARYLHPVVSSPREVPGLTVDPARLRYRVVLLPPDRAALAGTRALDYVHWGERMATAGRMGPAPAARRTCASRPSWWSLGAGAAGALLWCKTHYARHLAPLNPAGILADCNLYHIIPHPGIDTPLLAAALNATLVALFKELHGRANLGEGALKTEVSDLLALPVPDPRRLAPAASERLRRAWGELRRRPVSDLAGELRQADRQELDEALLEALSYGDATACREGRERLYAGVAGVLRERVGVARGSRGGGGVGKPDAAELAAAALAELRGKVADDNCGAEAAERERRITAVLGGFTRDRKLLAAALRLVHERLGVGASARSAEPSSGVRPSP